MTKGFTKTGSVLAPIDLKISPGEFVSILGPSGCGKSTLLRLASGLVLPDSGTVTVDSFGRNLFKGFVFQEAQLLPWLTVIENVSLPLELSGKAKSEAQNTAQKILATVGLGQSLELLPHQLSGGMKMRVSLARALVTNPSLLLLDEPFSSLDETTRYYLQEELRVLWQQLKMTVIFVTHSVSEAVFLADRVVVLSQRPAAVSLDKNINLGPTRDLHLRMQKNYVDQVQELSHFFRKLPGTSL